MVSIPYTLQLPEELHELLQHVIEASGETSEAILLDWLLHPIPYPSTENLNEILAQMAHFTKIQLWTLVYRQIPAEIEARHQVIVAKHEEGEKLTAREQAEWDSSTTLGQMVMVLRSKALTLLKEKGANIDILLNRELD